MDGEFLNDRWVERKRDPCTEVPVSYKMSYAQGTAITRAIAMTKDHGKRKRRIGAGN